MVSEFRALRASVIRLWMREVKHADRDTLYELTRFNEAIDMTWAESIASYSAQLDRSRELLIGMLGHDLRNPLGAVSWSARFLAESADPASVQADAATRILRSSARMERMISDLLDVTRTRLGGSLPVEGSAHGSRRRLPPGSR